MMPPGLVHTILSAQKTLGPVISQMEAIRPQLQMAAAAIEKHFAFLHTPEFQSSMANVMRVVEQHRAHAALMERIDLSPPVVLPSVSPAHYTPLVKPDELVEMTPRHSRRIGFAPWSDKD